MDKDDEVHLPPGIWLRRDPRMALFTVRIRRGSDLHVRPEAEQIDGKRFWFRYGFQLDAGERYGGEVAWVPFDKRYPEDAPHWIASGDLTYTVRNCSPLTGETQAVELPATSWDTDS